mmetsp:Transcript_6334/g.6547  ORF Transcript_6334/g.6547 Transcript_6334/m.6547 type:complete len:213 (+) Transcript_6334:34-672(+)
MGFEIECFVHPERISSQLICLICQGVLDRPVQTPSDHLFCEDELLEWMTRSNKCPVTNRLLEPDSITKPSRIIINMIGELERYCVNKARGCNWQGPCELAKAHEQTCDRRPIDDLLIQVQKKNEIISNLQSKIVILETKNKELKSLTGHLIDENQILHSRLKIYDAFILEHNKEEEVQEKLADLSTTRSKEKETDLQRTARLLRFGNIVENK